MEIFHTVNSGLYFRLDNCIVFIDGLHTGSQFGLSDTPGAVLDEMKAPRGFFAGDSLLLYTHFHDDHYDEKLTEDFLEMRPETRLFSPELSVNIHCETVERGLFLVRHGPFEIFALATAHQGGRDLQAPHCCYLLKAQGKAFLVCGDARFTESEILLLKSLAPEGIAAAFVNVYHLNTSREQRLMSLLGAKRIFIYHLPRPEDDRNSYCAFAREAMKLEGFDNLRLPAPMKRLVLV